MSPAETFLVNRYEEAIGILNCIDYQFNQCWRTLALACRRNHWCARPSEWVVEHKPKDKCECNEAAGAAVISYLCRNIGCTKKGSIAVGAL